MEGFVGRRGLIAPARLKALSRRSNAKGLMQTAAHLGAIALTTVGLAQAWGTLWAIPLFLLHGILLNFLYAAQHELSHWTVFESRPLNDLFGRIFGFVTFFPRDYDRFQHFAHHRHTQDWEKDAELLTRGPYRLVPYLLYFFGLTYWTGRWQRIARHAAGIAPEPFLTEAQRPIVIREARAHVAGYAAIAVLAILLQSWIPLLYWLAPMLVTKVVHQLQNTIEHAGLTHAPDTTVNTRTVRTIAPMRWLAWNMQYHAAHHTFPGVPFHALPQLHREIVDKLGRDLPTMGYLEFQAVMIARLANPQGEAAYADDENWIIGRT